MSSSDSWRRADWFPASRSSGTKFAEPAGPDETEGRGSGFTVSEAFRPTEGTEPISGSGTQAPRLWRAVCALGIAQIVSWGTLFYTIAVLGASMRADVGAGEIALFGSFTAGLFLSGMVSPWIGRRIDSHGGRQVLTAGSILGALAMAILGAAQGPFTMLEPDRAHQEMRLGVQVRPACGGPRSGVRPSWAYRHAPS